MMKRLFAILLILTMLAGCAAIVHADGLGTGVVKGGWLRMRSAPSTLSPVIGRYYTGTKLTLHSLTGTWYYVTAPDGKVGYMSRNYINLGAGGPIVPDGGWSGIPSGESGYVTSQNGRGVRLRSSPSTASSGNVIGLYSVGTKLTVLQRGTGWHYIQIGSQAGYMMAQFVVIGGSPAPTPIDPIPDTHYTAYVTSQNGKPVRLRTGPGTNYGLLGSFAVGTQVTVLKDLGAWKYIQIGSKKGYMMSTFLTTYAPAPDPYVPPVDPIGTIDSAQITIQSPIIGDRLYVYVTPSSADYNVHWYNDAGALLGSGNGYPVKNSDAGHRIRARVTGRNYWAGSIETLYTDVIAGKTTPIDPPAPSQTLTGKVTLPAVVSVDDTLNPVVTDCNASALTFTWYVDGLKRAQQYALYITSDMAGKTVQVVVTAAGYSNSLTAVRTVQNSAPVTPVVPEVEPITPSAEPVTPIVEPIIPEVEPITPVAEPITPVVEPVTPVVEPITPVVEPITPVVEPITPATEPETPAVEVITPATEQEKPLVEFITP